MNLRGQELGQGGFGPDRFCPCLFSISLSFPNSNIPDKIQISVLNFQISNLKYNPNVNVNPAFCNISSLILDGIIDFIKIPFFTRFLFYILIYNSNSNF